MAFARCGCEGRTEQQSAPCPVPRIDARSVLAQSRADARRALAAPTLSKGSCPTTRARSASGFSKYPSSPCVSGISRPAVTVPTTTSSCRLHRPSTHCHAASATMNGVAPRAAAYASSRASSAGSSASGTWPPRWVWRLGRGRSVGSSSVAAPASCVVQ